MKAFLSILCAFFILAKANATIERPKPSALLSNQIHYAPIIVYGTISDCNNDPVAGVTEANFTIHTVIKGVLEPQKIPISFKIHYAKRIDKTYKNVYKNGETKILFLSKNTTGNWLVEWEIGTNGNQVDMINTSIPDFKAGIALFEAKYTYFQEKKANNFSIVLENPTKNQTFAFLAKEMMGNLIYTPKKSSKQPAIGRKNVHKNTKKVKRKK
jgi:hypothetical protein